MDLFLIKFSNDEKMAVPLQRTNCAALPEITDEEVEYFRAELKYSSTETLNKVVRGETDGIGLIDNLIEHSILMGADINNSSHEDGNTPLIAAVLNTNIEHINCLLYYGADVMATNAEGSTVFDIIEYYESETGEHFSERIKRLLTDAKNTAH